MADGKRPKWTLDRNARVEVIASGNGFIVVIGAAFFWLDREALEDLMCLMADALESDDPVVARARDSN